MKKTRKEKFKHNAPFTKAIPKKQGQLLWERLRRYIPTIGMIELISKEKHENI